jgi:hypothetical protein
MEIQTALNEIVQKYGKDIYFDTRRLKGLLLDAQIEKKYITQSVLFLETGYLKQIIKSAPTQIDVIKQNMIVNDICEATGYNSNTVSEIVTCILVSVKIKSKIPIVKNEDELTTLKDCWIYYISKNDGLYKIHADGSNETEIIDDSIDSYDVVDNWIYYSYSDKTVKHPKSYLYKVRTDGSDKIKLSNDNHHFYNITVIDDWIYYDGAKKWINFSEGGKTHRIRTNGRNKTKLNNDEIIERKIAGDWIYYSRLSWIGSQHSICKMRTNGSNKTKLCDDYGFNITVGRDWIYYTNQSDSNKIYKMRTDGSNPTKILDDYVSFPFEVVSDWIYYMQSSGFYKIRTDGTGKAKISNNCPAYIQIVGNWIYYLTPYNQICRMRMDGSDETNFNITGLNSPIKIV